jgi:Fe-S cluster assembly ATP-binding protein
MKEEMSDAPLISIRNLHASAGETPILRGIDLELRAGEIHAIMGPNGSGKSTLSNVLVGKPGYEVTEGEILFRGENLLEMNPETRAREGVFLAFQYPVEIPGVANNYFLRTAVNAVREHRGLDELDAIDFLTFLKEKMKLVEMPEDMMSRSINEGFSGGEKKRNEILQMLLLEPSFCILDETDSGLDIDALRVVAGGVNQMRSPDRSMLIITHYQRLLDYIVPDHVHVLSNGRIVRSGDKSLAFELEAKGYSWVDELQGEEAAGRGAGS